MAEVLKCPHDRNNLRATIDCIRSKDANEIVNREWDGIVFGIAEFPFTPIIDGAFLDETPAKSLETKNFKKCNIMTGANKDEGVFFIMYYLTELFKNEESVLVDREDFIRSVGELNLYVKNVSTSQGAQRPFHLPKKYTESKTWIFWCKTIWGTVFTKGDLPLVGHTR